MTKVCERCRRDYTPNPKQSRTRVAAQRFCSRACYEAVARPPEGRRWTKADGDNPQPQSTWPCRSQPGGCGCRCHTIVQGKADSSYVARDAWLPQHDAMIRAMVAQGETPVAIAAALAERFSVPRTEQAVRRRLVRLDISTRDGWWSRWETSRLLGVSTEKLAKLERDGVIEPHSFSTWRRYRETDIERLIREQAGRAIDPRRVKNPQWRSLAEVSAIVNTRTA